VDADNLLMPAMALHDRNLAVEDDEEVAARITLMKQHLASLRAPPVAMRR